MRKTENKFLLHIQPLLTQQTAKIFIEVGDSLNRQVSRCPLGDGFTEKTCQKKTCLQEAEREQQKKIRF